MSQEELKQRVLKITEALYRTTDLFSDAEPLKWSLRKEALEVLNVHPQDVLRMEELVKALTLKLDLASSGTFISKTNFEVIKRAYGEFLSNTVSLRESYESLFLLDKPVGVLSDAVLDKRKGGDGGVVQSVALSGRKTTLLSALKQKGPLSVGELAKMLDEPISEKTIQRELAGLVASGAIRQEGDRRWRKYFIS